MQKSINHCLLGLVMCQCPQCNFLHVFWELGTPVFLFFFISSFLYATKGYDNYEQIIMGLVDHIAM